MPRRHRFGVDDGKSDRLEAETGILHCRKRFELKLDQTRHMGNAAGRRGETDIDGLDRAIDAIKAKPKAARADVVADEHMDEILHQPAGAGDDGRRRDDRLDEIVQAVIDRRRDDGDERLVDAAECLIETA